MFNEINKFIRKRSWGTLLKFYCQEKEHQEYTVKALINSGELFMANEFINTLNMDKNLFKIDENDILEEKKRKKESCYQLKLDLKNVHIIDNSEKIGKLNAILTEKHKYIGMDAEYLPSKIRSFKRLASLLQLSTSNAVYIIDLLALHSNNELNEILNHIMHNFEICKIGFSFSDDIKSLKYSCPKLISLRKIKSLVDLQKMWKPYSKIRKIEIFKRTPGLSDICQKILGMPIDKTMQGSDWGKRPLMPEQVIYAAVDAYVLIEMYKNMQRRIKKNPEIEI